jgi:uracil phosphoribosyltransferase
MSEYHSIKTFKKISHFNSLLEYLLMIMWSFQVIEYALSLLPYHSVAVQTPQGVTYEGKRSSVKKICGVSILRAGETMEAALTEVCKDIRYTMRSY